MPGSTPVLAIPYPLLNETVDPAIFQSFAVAVDTAILATQTSAQFELTGRPTYRGVATSANNPAVGPNVTTSLTFSTPTVDNNTFFSGGAPTRATINTAGVYLMTYNLEHFGWATFTKMYLDILYNGATILAAATNHGSLVSDDVNLPFMWPFYAADFLQFRWVWQGTGTAQPTNVNVNIQWLCPLTFPL